MKKLVALIGMLAVLTCGANAWASISGTLYSNGSGSYGLTDTSGGAIGINAVVGTFSYSVSQVGDLWDYVYTWTPTTANKNRGVGAIAIQFGQTADFNMTSEGYNAAGVAKLNPTIQTIDRTLASGYDSWLSAASPSTTKVDVNTTFQGLQWIWDNTDPSGANYITLEIKTALAPVWGDFFMDGYNTTTNNGYSFYRNTDYDSAAQDFVSGQTVFGKVLTPGQIPAAPVPIPPAVFLFGSGLSGLFFLKRRKFTA
jgi:hypothetical protein